MSILAGILYSNEILFQGFIDGLVYALIAMGLVLIYKATGVINFAGSYRNLWWLCYGHVDGQLRSSLLVSCHSCYCRKRGCVNSHRTSGSS